MKLFDDLSLQFGDSVIELLATATPCITVKPECIREVARFCFTAGYDSLLSLSGMDTKGMKAAPLPPDSPKDAKPVPPPEEFRVVYHIGSTTAREVIAIRVVLDRADPRVPSVSDVWGVANWHEREAFDMYGIVFEGHPDLVRILCPEDWTGWPLRKDYVFPEKYHDVPHQRMPSGAQASAEVRTGDAD